jgi:hypothetical protein
MDKIQAVRDLVRPILTLQISTAYIGLTCFGYYRHDIQLLEAIGLLGTYFGSMITYHFVKSSKKDGG